MIISLFVAAAEKNEIGVNNKMPWHLPKDWEWFKKNTLGKPVIMGRLTHESIGRPLPGRLNIVITRNADYQPLSDDVLVATSLNESINIAAQHTENPELFIIGGGQIYKDSLPLADKIYVTRVHQTYPEADAFFPKLKEKEWQETFSEKHTEEGDKPAFTFYIYERI